MGLSWGVLAAAGCSENGGTRPGTVRFGQIGSLESTLAAPLRLGAGELVQRLTWTSSGFWTLRESISYRGLVGDESVSESLRDPATYAGAYASLNTVVNSKTTGLALFVDELDPSLDPECVARTRIHLEIYDEITADTVSWDRCADGSLANLTTRNAGPDPAAARVVAVVQQARDGTVGSDFSSVYAGSVPFGTLDRGQDTPADLQEPTAFTDEGEWLTFWGTHAPGTEAPEVDFDQEMVVVGAVGERDEAGDSVEVRRVLQVDDGSLVEVWEGVPGDFCTPAERVHTPFHIVVAPRLPEPIRFADIRVETVPCGG